MSFNNKIEFTRANIDLYLKELSKEYKKRAAKGMRAEVILVGGAAVLVNYGFRDMTTDVDAMYEAASSMKEAINYVGEKYDLPRGWLNEEFEKTESYSPKLRLYATKYKTYSNIVDFYTIKAEYLIAMKLKSGRVFKHDLSDALGILVEHKKQNAALSLDSIRTATCNLYGSWESLPELSRKFIEDVFLDEDYEERYSLIKKQEEENRSALLELAETSINAETSNIDEVLFKLRER